MHIGGFTPSSDIYCAGGGGDLYGQDGGTDVSVRTPHLLANYKVKLARLWIKLSSAKRKLFL